MGNPLVRVDWRGLCGGDRPHGGPPRGPRPRAAAYQRTPAPTGAAGWAGLPREPRPASLSESFFAAGPRDPDPAAPGAGGVRQGDIPLDVRSLFSGLRLPRASPLTDCEHPPRIPAVLVKGTSGPLNADASSLPPGTESERRWRDEVRASPPARGCCRTPGARWFAAAFFPAGAARRVRGRGRSGSAYLWRSDSATLGPNTPEGSRPPGLSRVPSRCLHGSRPGRYPRTPRFPNRRHSPFSRLLPPARLPIRVQQPKKIPSSTPRATPGHPVFYLEL